MQNGDTPLHLAADNNHSDVVRILLKHSQDLVAISNAVITFKVR
jgi:ankyrin repeat protein